MKKASIFIAALSFMFFVVSCVDNKDNDSNDGERVDGDSIFDDDSEKADEDKIGDRGETDGDSTSNSIFDDDSEKADEDKIGDKGETDGDSTSNRDVEPDEEGAPKPKIPENILEYEEIYSQFSGRNEGKSLYREVENIDEIKELFPNYANFLSDSDVDFTKNFVFVLSMGERSNCCYDMDFHYLLYDASASALFFIFYEISPDDFCMCDASMTSPLYIISVSKAKVTELLGEEFTAAFVPLQIKQCGK